MMMFTYRAYTSGITSQGERVWGVGGGWEGDD